MKRRVLIAGAIAFGLIASACSGSDETAETDTASELTTTESDTPTETTANETETTGVEATGADAPATIEPGDPSTFFPDVLDAEATQADDGTWTFDVTLSSPYDTPEQYADAWRVVGPDGTELGFRLLTHDHASEQPFTRSESGIEIPDGVTTVTIEGRDQANGYGGTFLEYELPA